MKGLGHLASGSATYLVSNILGAAIPFALLPVLTRYLDPAEYGQVAMFQVLLAALPALVGLSIEGAANRKYFDGQAQDLRGFIGTGVQLVLANTLIAFLLVVLFQNPMSEWLQLRKLDLYLGVVAAFCAVMVQLRLGQWQVRKRARLYGVFQVTSSLLAAGLSLLLVVVAGQGAEGRIFAQTAALLVSALLALVLLARDRLFAFRMFQAKHARELLAFGVPLLPHLIGLFFLSTVDRAVIATALNLADAGIYAASMQLAICVGIIYGSINTAYAPWLFERLAKNSTADNRGIVKLTYVHFTVAGAIAALAFAVGPWAVRTILGSTYAGGQEIIGLLVLGQTFGGMYLMVCNYIFYARRTGSISAVTIGTGTINVALLVLGCQMFGLVGASMAYAASMFVRFVLTWWVAGHAHPMPWFSAFHGETR